MLNFASRLATTEELYLHKRYDYLTISKLSFLAMTDTDNDSLTHIAEYPFMAEGNGNSN